MKYPTTELLDVIHAVEAVTRIPDDYKDVTFFSENDLWNFDTKDDDKVCPVCNELEFGSPFQGNHLRRWFAGHPYADMVILDRNTIGGPGVGGNGLLHPNCRCRLRRSSPVKEPVTLTPSKGRAWAPEDVGLKRLNPTKQLFDRAKKDFGVTYDLREVGYVLPDGQMLDFSGKNIGGTPGMRSLDHREISKSLELGDYGISGTDAMIYFEREGALRFTFSRGDLNISFETAQTITEQQWSRLRQAVSIGRRDFGSSDVYFDIYAKNGNRLVSNYFERARPADINKIKTIFDQTQKEDTSLTEQIHKRRKLTQIKRSLG